MISLARTTLRRDWRRFLPAVFAVGFAGLLVLIQLALMLGIFRTVSVYIDQSTADLWVGYPGTPSVDLARPIPAKIEMFVRQHPEVLATESFHWAGGDIRRPDGTAVGGIVTGIDPRPGAMMFARVLSPQLRRALEEPDTVLVDVSNANNLGVQVGGRLEINGKRVKVVGLTQGLGAIGGPNIVASFDTARRLDGAAGDDEVAYFLVRLRDPARAAQVGAALAPTGPTRAYEVWTADDFSVRSQAYWLLETGMGLGFAFSGALGLLIGVVITSQTLKAVINGSLREYATLRALGVSLRSLRLVVVEQAAWVGLVGVGVTTLVTMFIGHLARSQHVLVFTPWWAYAGSAVFVLLIALFSGLLSLQVLVRAEPASLLR
jgi:putative ABC transport system permease protein